jgi:hypothetical protein
VMALSQCARKQMTIKEQVLESIQQLPSDITYDDALEQIAILAAIERALEDFREGRAISHDEFVQEAMQWTIE